MKNKLGFKNLHKQQIFKEGYFFLNTIFLELSISSFKKKI